MAKKPTLTTISSGYASNTTLNNNFEELRDAFDNTLSLDGSTPNSMSADFDLNGNDILNAGNIYVDGVNLLNLLDNITVSAYAPSGGNDGDVWFKVGS
tara:strand:+ start:125 stop:418 length:294 start_codon:yes stop_codon:yes gene_type:complete